MKKTTKIAALAAGVVAAALTSHAAAGDLLVGIYANGVNQTFVYDIGTFGSLFQGETWNLDSLSGGKLFGSTGSGGAGFSAGTLNGASFGVVGYAGNGATVYYTTPDGTVADLSQADAGSIRGAVNGIPTGVKPINSSQTDWKTLTTSSTGSDVFDVFGVNINGTQGNHVTLLTGAQFSSDATPDSFFQLGTDGTLQYGVAVPEPSTYGMFAGAGILALSLRKQFRRQQA